MAGLNYIGHDWECVPGELAAVASGQSGVWGVSPDHQIVYRELTYGNPEHNGISWKAVDGDARCLSSGSDSVWCINTQDDIFYRSDIGPETPTGSSWVQVEGKASHVTVNSTKNSVYIIKNEDQVWRRRDVQASRPGGSKWQFIEGAMIDLSAGSAGLWGVNNNGKVCYRVGTSALDGDDDEGTRWQEVDGDFFKTVTSGNRVVWAVNTFNHVFYRLGITQINPSGSGWHKLTGDLTQISVDSVSNAVWATGRDHSIYRRLIIAGMDFTTAEQSIVSGKLTWVSVGQAGTWGCNRAGDIYYRSADKWNKVSGKLQQISSGRSMVWGVNSKNWVYYREGISPDHPGGTKWHRVEGTLKQVSVSDVDDAVWGLDTEGNVYHRTEVTNPNVLDPVGKHWQVLDGKFCNISAGPSGVWACNSLHEVYYRTGTGPFDQCDKNEPGHEWVEIPGTLRVVSSGTAVVWGMDSKNQVFYRSGVLPSLPEGSEWIKVKGSLTQISVGNGNRVYGVNQANEIFTLGTNLTSGSAHLSSMCFTSTLPSEINRDAPPRCITAHVHNTSTVEDTRVLVDHSNCPDQLHVYILTPGHMASLDSVQRIAVRQEIGQWISSAVRSASDSVISETGRTRLECTADAEHEGHIFALLQLMCDDKVAGKVHVEKGVDYGRQAIRRALWMSVSHGKDVRLIRRPGQSMKGACSLHGGVWY